jgi:hypothetical protein
VAAVSPRTRSVLAELTPLLRREPSSRRSGEPSPGGRRGPAGPSRGRRRCADRPRRRRRPPDRRRHRHRAGAPGRHGRHRPAPGGPGAPSGPGPHVAARRPSPGWSGPGARSQWTSRRCRGTTLPRSSCWRVPHRRPPTGSPGWSTVRPATPSSCWSWRPRRPPARPGPPARRACGTPCAIGWWTSTSRRARRCSGSQSSAATWTPLSSSP